MKKVTRWIGIALPFLMLGSDELANMDDNDTGKDDETAKAIELCVEILTVVKTGTPLPTKVKDLFKEDEIETAKLETQDISED